MTRNGVAATFWALSDPLRVEILDRIAEGSATTVSDLAERVPVTRQAVSRHVRTLETAGLVVGERHGREHRFAVEPTSLEDAQAWLERRSGAWGATLRRLADYVESLPGEQ